MQPKKSIFVLSFIFLLAFIFRSPSYFSGDGGYQSKSSDILNHYYVTEAVRHAELFPDWDREETSDHAVSNRLPVYHGLILAHSFAAVLVQLGLPLPGSLQLISDLAFAISLIVLFLLIPVGSKRFRFAFLIYAIVLAGYAYLIQLYSASYSQTFGMALGLLLFYLIRMQKAPRLCFVLLFISAFAYPDSILVLAPLVAWNLTQEKRKLEFGIVSILWLVCLTIFVRRFSLHGPLNNDLSASYALAILFFGYRFFFEKQDVYAYEKKLLISYTMLLIALMAYSLVVHQQLNYYLNKYTSWSYYVLLLASFAIRDWKKQIVVAVVFVVLFVSGLGEGGDRKSYVLSFFSGDHKVLLTNQSWYELNALFSHPDYPRSSKITSILPEDFVQQSKISNLAVIAIGRGYNLTSGLIFSQIYSSYNEGKPLPMTRLSEKAQYLSSLGESGQKGELARLSQFPDEVLIWPRQYWKEEWAREFKFIRTDHLVAIWRK